MQKTFINLATERGRGIDALKGTSVPAVFCDAVKVQLRECVMLFISGKVGMKPDNTLAGRTMREQTQQTLENIREILTREGGTMDDIVRVRVYVTQVDALSLRDIHDVRSKFWTEGKYPASTLVRVDQLIRDGALIEIDADAVIAAS
jgi:enamine deaminase RidA (YjgF/YER057c/UK114 family)